MKASNFTTPRTLGECQFIASHDPIEHHPRSRAGVIAWLVCAGLAVAALATIAAR
jgi:hypothetical protein